jgi:hypothetical protein
MVFAAPWMGSVRHARAVWNLLVLLVGLPRPSATPRVGAGLVGLLPRQGDDRGLLSEAGPEATRILLNGRIWGLGRATERNVNGEMNRLRNAMEVAARRSPDRQ